MLARGVTATVRQFHFLGLVLAQTWTVCSALVWLAGTRTAPEARAFAAAATNGTHMFMAGGFSHAYHRCLADLWVLDVQQGTWSMPGNTSSSDAANLTLPTGPLMGHSLTLFYGSPQCSEAGCLVLVGGTRLCGAYDTASLVNASNWNAEVWVLPLTVGADWVQAPVELPAPLAHHAAVAVGGVGGEGAAADGWPEQAVLITGGLTVSGAVTDAVQTLAWSWEESALTLSNAGRLPAAVFGHAAALRADGGVWLFGGMTSWLQSGASLESELSQLKEYMTDAVVVLSPRVGNSAGSYRARSEPTLPDPVAFAAAWAVNDTLYVYGGARKGNSPCTALSVYSDGAWLGSDEVRVAAASAFPATANGTRASRLAPPLLIGAAYAAMPGTSGTAAGQDIEQGGSTSSVLHALVFGGWQAPDAVRKLPLDVWSAVDDEMTWAWQSSVAAGSAGWRFVAHGAPSRRIDARLVEVIFPDGERKLVMHGGRVPGGAAMAQSAFRFQELGGLATAGGAIGFDLRDAVTSYWFNDWWLVDGDPLNGEPPLRLRLVDPTSQHDTVDIPGELPALLDTLHADGGRAAVEGQHVLLWEQKMSLHADDMVVVSEVAEAGLALLQNVSIAQVGLEGGSGWPRVGWVSVTPLPDRQASATNTTCLPRLGATLTSLGITTSRSNVTTAFYDFLAMHGGIRLTVGPDDNGEGGEGPGGVVYGEAWAATCVYDLQAQYWIPPPTTTSRGAAPKPRYYHVCDGWPGSNTSYAMVCYGGLGPENQLMGEVDWYTLPASFYTTTRSANRTETSGWWQRLVDGDQTPGPRYAITSFGRAAGPTSSTDETARDVLRGTYVMVGGRTGPSPAQSTARDTEVWLLWVHCMDSTGPGASRVATWTQVFQAASGPVPSNGLRVEGAAVTGAAVVLVAVPSLPQATVTPFGITTMGPWTDKPAGVQIARMGLRSCMAGVQTQCAPVINSFRWVAREQGMPPTCWTAAKRSSVRVVIGEPSVSSVYGEDAEDTNMLQMLLKETVVADVRDTHGVSLITESPFMPCRQEGSSYIYWLPPVLRAPHNTHVKVHLRMMTYSWPLAAITLTLNDSMPSLEVSMTFPPVSQLAVQAYVPKGLVSTPDVDGNSNGSSSEPQYRRKLQDSVAGPSYVFEVLPVAPDGRELTRGCMHGSASLSAEVAPQACYQTWVNSSGVAVLTFLMPDSAWSDAGIAGLASLGRGLAQARAAAPAPPPAPNTALTGSASDAVVYRVRARILSANGEYPELSGVRNVDAGALVEGVRNTSLTPLNVTLSDTPDDPMPDGEDVTFNIEIRSSLPQSDVQLPSATASRRWQLSVYDYTGASDTTQRAPVCRVIGRYSTTAKAQCAENTALVPGYYQVMLADQQDTASVLASSHFTVIAGTQNLVSLSVDLTPVSITPYFSALASSIAPNGTSGRTPVDDVTIRIIRTSSGREWDREVSVAGSALFSLPPANLAPSGSTQGFVAVPSLPGLPSGLALQNLTIDEDPDPAAVATLQLALPGYLLCEPNSHNLLSESSGTFPAQPMLEVVRPPGLACSWTLRNPGQDLPMTLNFSLLGPGDLLLITGPLSRGQPLRISLTTVPSGYMQFRMSSDNITISLVSDTNNNSWGYGIAIAWQGGGTSTSFLPTQLVLLIVSTISAGGAILAFILLWHFCYRPLARTRGPSDAGGSDGADGAAGALPPGGAAATHHGGRRRHVSKRLLRLMPTHTFLPPGGTKRLPQADDNTDAVDEGYKKTETGEAEVGREGGAEDAAASCGGAGSDGGSRADGTVTVIASATSLAGVAATATHGGGTPDVAAAAAPKTKAEHVVHVPVHGEVGVRADEPASTPPTTSTDGLTDGAAPECCAICLSDYVAGDVLRTLPCGHGFHVACIDQWLRRDVACPLCKRDVVELAAFSPDPLVAALAEALLRKRAAAAAARAGQATPPATAATAAAAEQPEAAPRVMVVEMTASGVVVASAERQRVQEEGPAAQVEETPVVPVSVPGPAPVSRSSTSSRSRRGSAVSSQPSHGRHGAPTAGGTGASQVDELGGMRPPTLAPAPAPGVVTGGVPGALSRRRSIASVDEASSHAPTTPTTLSQLPALPGAGPAPALVRDDAVAEVPVAAAVVAAPVELPVGAPGGWFGVSGWLRSRLWGAPVGTTPQGTPRPGGDDAV